MSSPSYQASLKTSAYSWSCCLHYRRRCSTISWRLLGMIDGVGMSQNHCCYHFRYAFILLLNIKLMYPTMFRTSDTTCKE